MNTYPQESFDSLNHNLSLIFNINFVSIEVPSIDLKPADITSPFAGHQHTDESKLLMSEAKRGKDNGKRSGSTNTEQHRKRISDSLKGKARSDEARAAISRGKTGKPVTQAHRDNISKSKKGKPLSAEHRQKLKEAQIRRRAREKDYSNL